MRATELLVGDAHTNPDVPSASYTVETVSVLLGVRYASGAGDLLQFDASAVVAVARDAAGVLALDPATSTNSDIPAQEGAGGVPLMSVS